MSSLFSSLGRLSGGMLPSFDEESSKVAFLSVSLLFSWNPEACLLSFLPSGSVLEDSCISLAWWWR